MTGPRIGALEVPVPAPGPEQIGGDPTLETFVAFIVAVIRADAQTAWTALGTPRQTPDVVHEVRLDKLEAATFNEGMLPAIHAWRENGDSAQLAADYRVERSTIVVEWICPPAPQDPKRRRPAFLNALGKVVNRAIKRERHPAWKVPGDPDPQAATSGSLLWTHAGTWKESPRWRRSTFELDRDDTKRGTDATYLAVRWEIEVEERDEDGPFDELAGLLATMTEGDPDDPAMTVQFDGELPED